MGCIGFASSFAILFLVFDFCESAAFLFSVFDFCEPAANSFCYFDLIVLSICVLEEFQILIRAPV